MQKIPPVSSTRSVFAEIDAIRPNEAESSIDHTFSRPGCFDRIQRHKGYPGTIGITINVPPDIDLCNLLRDTIRALNSVGIRTSGDHFLCDEQGAGQ